MFRKIYHLGGLFFPLVYLLLSREIAIYTATVVFILVLVFDLLRLNYKDFNILVLKKLPIGFKKKEIHRISGSPYFLAGVLISLIFFKFEYMLGGVILLSVGDLSAVTVGKSIGKIKIYNKTLEGTIGFIFFSILVLVILKSLNIHNLSFNSILIASVITSIVELLPLKIDDNLLIPVVGSFILSILN